MSKCPISEILDVDMSAMNDAELELFITRTKKLVESATTLKSALASGVASVRSPRTAKPKEKLDMSLLF